MATFPLGVTYEIDPLPLVAEDTALFPAGAVTIGIESRKVDLDVLKEGFGEALVESQMPMIDDVGVSLHVLGSDDKQEYLRFDCFADDPHYHYILWGTRQTIVPFDENASGEMLTWALEAITHRLSAMLVFAGADELAAAVDQDLVRVAIDEVAPIAREAQRKLRAAVG